MSKQIEHVQFVSICRKDEISFDIVASMDGALYESIIGRDRRWDWTLQAKSDIYDCLVLKKQTQKWLGENDIQYLTIYT